MEPGNKRFWTLKGCIMAIMLVLSILYIPSRNNVQAEAKRGWVTVGSDKYYYDSNGQKHKGWLDYNGSRYYMDQKTGKMTKQWMEDGKGNKWYFSRTNGKMRTGWVKNSKDERRYFDPQTGIMRRGWNNIDGKTYYFYRGSGIAVVGYRTDSKGNIRYFRKKTKEQAFGWVKNSKNQWVYFDPNNKGIMAKGFYKINGKKYYFEPSKGKLQKGWINVNGKTYFGDNKDGELYTGTKYIDGIKHEFSDSGELVSKSSDNIFNTTTAESAKVNTSAKTIKNLLVNAIKPLGRVVYIWGGGHEKNYDGLSPAWRNFYNRVDENYSFRGSHPDNGSALNDLSYENMQLGLDCSGYISWVVHNQLKTNVISVSGDMGYILAKRNYGNVFGQNALVSNNYKIQPGDIGFNDDHIWMAVGQCDDKSTVVIHCTADAGVQISGTAQPGGAPGKAQFIAAKYMSRFQEFNKPKFRYSLGDWMRQYQYFRWNRKTLKDPDGYLHMDPDRILADLLGA